MKKVPTSYHARRTAKERSVQWMGSNEYMVYGGRSIHRVSVFNYRDMRASVCDCANQNEVKSGICSHILAVFENL